MQVYMGGIAPISLASLKKSTCLAISLAGCDFSCPYCNAPELLDFKPDYLIDILEAKRRINLYANTVDAVIFTGGEPTLQRQALLSLARHCKQIGLKVGVSTNASRPQTMLFLLRENILDFIEVDLKTPPEPEIFEKVTHSKNFFKQTEEIIDEVKETIWLLKRHENSLQVFFKTIIIPGITDDEKQLESIGKLIENLKCVWILQSFSPEKTHEKSMMEKQAASIEMLEFLKKKLSLKFPKMIIEAA